MSRALQRWRLPLALAVLVLAAAGLIALLAPDKPAYDPLSPRSAEKTGAKAMAQVLGDEGVSVTEIDRYAAVQRLDGRSRTLLVVGGDYLPADTIRSLSRVADRVVLLQPSSTNLDDLGISLSVLPANFPRQVRPACSWPAAQNAGPAELDGSVFVSDDLPPATTLCYPMPGTEDGTVTGAVATVDKGGVDYVLLGSASVLRNDSVTEPGRAALGLWSLGAHEEVVWWMVDPFDPTLTANAAADPLSLLPGWVSRVQWWLLGVAVLAMVWRWRRMGRLVPEPLPVVVRSAETARGRAALYRRANARDRAAAVLRADALRTLARRASLPASAPADDVARAAAAAADQPVEHVRYMLLGPPPSDDRQLTRLADDLDTLTRKATR